MNKYLCLYLTDTHLSEKTLDVNVDIFQQAIRVCKQKKIPTIIHGGDVFNSRRQQSLQVLSTAQEILCEIKKEGLNFVYLRGNHDKTNTTHDKSWLDIICKSDTSDMVAIDFYDREVFHAHLNRLKKQLGPKISNTILFVHIGISEYFLNEAGREHVIGEAVLKDFEGFKKVISGHYHARKEMDNVLYPGSPYQSGFGDKGEKGFLLIRDSEEFAYEYHKTNFPKYYTFTTDVCTKELFLDHFKLKSMEGVKDYYKVKLTTFPSTSDMEFFSKNGIHIDFSPKTTHIDPKHFSSHDIYSVAFLILKKKLRIDKEMDKRVSKIFKDYIKASN